MATHSSALGACVSCYLTYSGSLDSWIEEFLDSSGKSYLEFWTSFSTNLITLFEIFFVFLKYIFLKILFL